MARGYEVETAVDGEEALLLAERFAPDLVVLDLNLPGIDGFEVCRRLRTWSATPVIVLSVREDESDKVEALDLGRRRLPDQAVRDRRAARRGSARCSVAARTGARRSHRGSSPTVSRSTWRRTGSCATARAVRLTKTEWALLEAFAGHPGKLLTHGWLLTHVWGEGYADDVDVLRVFVSQLRKKIEREHTRPTIIVTEPGVGYRWVLRAAPVDG